MAQYPDRFVQHARTRQQSKQNMRTRTDDNDLQVRIAVSTVQRMIHSRLRFGLFSFGCSRLAGAIDGYDANHSLSPIRQTRVAKTALFVIRPVLQATAIRLQLFFRNDNFLG